MQDNEEANESILGVHEAIGAPNNVALERKRAKRFNGTSPAQQAMCLMARTVVCA